MGHRARLDPEVSQQIPQWVLADTYAKCAQPAVQCPEGGCYREQGADGHQQKSGSDLALIGER